MQNQARQLKKPGTVDVRTGPVPHNYDKDNHSCEFIVVHIFFPLDKY